MAQGQNFVPYVLLGKTPTTFFSIVTWPICFGVASGRGWISTGHRPLLMTFAYFLRSSLVRRGGCFGLASLPCAGSYGPWEISLLFTMFSLINLIVCLKCYLSFNSENYWLRRLILRLQKCWSRMFDPWHLLSTSKIKLFPHEDCVVPGCSQVFGLRAIVELLCACMPV